MDQNIDELKAKALDGDADAQYNLGYRYFHGEGVAQDKKEACKWFDKAAEQGNAAAQTLLGICYCDPGNGVRSDKFIALYWFEKAAAQGQSIAQYLLGKLLIQGVDYLKNVEKGLYWIQQAASQGLEEAIDFLRYYGY